MSWSPGAVRVGGSRKDKMWDDEDNNPYGSFQRQDSEINDVPAFSDGTESSFCLTLPEGCN